MFWRDCVENHGEAATHENWNNHFGILSFHFTFQFVDDSNRMTFSNKWLSKKKCMQETEEASTLKLPSLYGVRLDGGNELKW